MECFDDDDEDSKVAETSTPSTTWTMSFVAYPSPAPDSRDGSLPLTRHERKALRRQYDAMREFSDDSNWDSDDARTTAPEPKPWTSGEERDVAQNTPKSYDGTKIPIEAWSNPELYAIILNTPPIPRTGAVATKKETFRVIYVQYGYKGPAHRVVETESNAYAGRRSLSKLDKDCHWMVGYTTDILESMYPIVIKATAWGNIAVETRSDSLSACISDNPWDQSKHPPDIVVMRLRTTKRLTGRT